MAEDNFVKPSFYDFYHPEEKKVETEENPEIEGDYINLQNDEGEISKVYKADAPTLIHSYGYKPLNEEQKKRVILERKFGTTGQEFLAGAEGVAEGASFGLINRVENAIGENFDLPELTFEAQEARKLVNPKAALTGQIGGTAGMFLLTGGFGGLGAKTAARLGLASEAAALKTYKDITALGLKAGLPSKVITQAATVAKNTKLAEFSILSRIGARGIANAVEGAVYASGQEAVKTIFRDPNQSLGSAATNIGLYGLLGGGVTGAAFAGAGELWKARFGVQTLNSLDELYDALNKRIETAQTDPMVDAVVNKGIIPEIDVKVPINESQPLDTPTVGVEFQIPGEKANAPQIREATKRLGVEPPVGSLEQDKLVGQKASVLAGTDTWQGNKLRRQQLETNNKLQKIFAEDLLIDRSEPNIEKYDVGKEAKNYLVNKETGFFTKLYNQLSKRYDDVMKHFNAIDLDVETKANARTSILENEIVKGTTNPEITNRIDNIVKQFDKIKTLKQLKEFNTNQVNDAIIEAQNQGKTQLVKALGVVKKALKQARAEGIRNASVEIAGREGQEIAERFLKEITDLDKEYALYKNRIKDFLIETDLGPNEYRGDLRTLIQKLDKIKAEDLGQKLLDVRDRDKILFLKDNYPEIFENLRKFKIKEIFDTATSMAQGSENKLRSESIFRQLKKMGKTMTDIILPDKRQLIDDLQLLYSVSPEVFNPPNTAAASSFVDYLGKKFLKAEDKAGLIKTILYESGTWAKSLVVDSASTIQKLIKYGGDDNAANIGVAKLLTAVDRETNAVGYKVMTDYIRQVLKGETNTNKAIDNLMKGAPIIIPQHLKPDEKVKEKLDKRVKQFGENPSAMLDMHQDFNHYMSDHGMAIAAASANAVNYLNTIRPVERRESPLDDPTQPSLIEKQNYNIALSIAQQPLMILEDIKDGTLNSQKLLHLQNLYPDFYANMRYRIMNELVNITEKKEKIPYKTRMGLSLFLGTPLDSTMKPEGIMALQPKMAQAQQQQQQAMMPMQQAAQGGGRQRGTMKNIGKLADQQLTPMQTRIMEKQSVKV